MVHVHQVKKSLEVVVRMYVRNVIFLIRKHQLKLKMKIRRKNNLKCEFISSFEFNSDFFLLNFHGTPKFNNTATLRTTLRTRFSKPEFRKKKWSSGPCSRPNSR